MMNICLKKSLCSQKSNLLLIISSHEILLLIKNFIAFCDKQREKNSCLEYHRGREILFRAEGDGVEPRFFVVVVQLKWF